MALSIYSPPFESNSSGEIKGEVTSIGMEDHVEWFAFQHEINAPFDPNTGNPRGRRQQSPVIATKRIDRATPLLHDTLGKNGTIAKVEFLFHRPSATGTEEHYFTITLEEARVVSVRHEQLNNRYPDNMPLDVSEHVSFTYDKITWEAVIAGTMAFDSWAITRRGG